MQVREGNEVHYSTFPATPQYPGRSSYGFSELSTDHRQAAQWKARHRIDSISVGFVGSGMKENGHIISLPLTSDCENTMTTSFVGNIVFIRLNFLFPFNKYLVTILLCNSQQSKEIL
jgi:hypothetical protein